MNELFQPCVGAGEPRLELGEVAGGLRIPGSLGDQGQSLAKALDLDTTPSFPRSTIAAPGAWSSL